MSRIFKFGFKLYKKVKCDDLSGTANQLTYKLLLALFPFIIFAMSVLGFLSLDSKLIIGYLAERLPKQIMDLFYVFVVEVIDVKSASITIYSLIVSILSASSGFETIIKSINKTYEQDEKRGFIVIKLLSISLVLLFTLTLVFSTMLFIFGDTIKKTILKYDASDFFVKYGFGFTSYFLAVLVLLVCSMIIYKISPSRKVSFLSVLPGSCVSVVLWIISSRIFNLYINNFSKYSKIYGSIGSVFILMLWLKLMSYFLLIGSEVNALVSIDTRKKT